MSKSISQNDKNPLNKFSKKYIPEIDLLIKEFLEKKRRNIRYQFPKEFYLLLENFCLRKGKRIRPLLVLISYLGYKNDKKNLKEIIKIAAVMEMMHSFLLIQDDIIDRSLTRRGEKTLHVLCQEHHKDRTNNKNIGNDIALILADVLLFNAIEIISDVKIDLKIKNEFLKLFAETYELTAWGQILDSLNSLTLKLDIDSSDPMQISILKTAYYTISSPLLIGYRLTGRRDKKIETGIRDFAIPLGLAFQIRDDILGVFGKKEETGKPSDSDILEGKHTLLIQNTIKNLNRKERVEFTQKFTKEKKTKKDVASIKSLIKKSGALKKSNEKIKELTNTSRKNLLKLKIKKEEEMILSSLIDSIAEV